MIADALQVQVRVPEITPGTSDEQLVNVWRHEFRIVKARYLRTASGDIGATGPAHQLGSGGASGVHSTFMCSPVRHRRSAIALEHLRMACF